MPELGKDGNDLHKPMERNQVFPWKGLKDPT